MLVEHAVEQGSPEWFEARRGVFSASSASKLLTPTGKLSTSLNGEIARLIAEQELLQEPEAGFTSGWMQHGIDTEHEAANAFTLLTGLEVRTCGFFRDGLFGASPDRIIESANVPLEIKCPKPSTHIQWLLNDGVPKDHVAQVHFQIALLGVQYGYFMSYCPGMKPIIIRQEADQYTAAMRDAFVRADNVFKSAMKQLEERQ